MVDTIQTRKFSEFVTANLDATNKTVGLSGGANAIFEDPVNWNTAGRPTTPTNGLLGFNTDLQLYEYYDVISGDWVQLDTAMAFTWNNITGTSETMEADNGYVSNNAGVVTLTLPVLCEFGQTLRVCGYGSGGWKISFNAGQNLVYGTAVATTTTGTLESTRQYDQVELLCVVANTTFIVLSSQGNLTVT